MRQEEGVQVALVLAAQRSTHSPCMPFLRCSAAGVSGDVPAAWRQPRLAAQACSGPVLPGSCPV